MMPNWKVKKTKGLHPKPPKTSRKELPVDQRASIVTSNLPSEREAQVWARAEPPNVPVSARAVRAIRNKARNRAKSNRSGLIRGGPLQENKNVVNLPRAPKERKL